MDRSRISKFCHCCGSSVEQNFKFCSQCGQAVVITNDNQGSRSTGNETMSTSSTTTSSATASRDTNKSSTSLSLKSFNAFKTAKEKERSSFFVRKKGSKRAKLDTNEVKITIAVMEDITKIKRGDSLPLKVPASSSA